MQIQDLTSRHEQACELATALVESIRQLSKNFPEEEDMAMVPQIREAVMELHKAVLLASRTEINSEFHYYTDEARGKSAVLDTLLHICRDLGYCPQETFENLIRNIDALCDLMKPPPRPKLELIR